MQQTLSSDLYYIPNIANCKPDKITLYN